MPIRKKLSKINVEGYKSIKSLSIGLEDINILIGQNGAGKSNFISTFKLLRNVIEQRLQYYVSKNGGANNILYYGAKETKEITFNFDFEPNHYKLVLEPSTEDNLFIKEEFTAYDWSGQPYSSKIADGELESSLKLKAKVKGGMHAHVYSTISSWRVYHFHDTSDSSPIKNTSLISDNIYLFEDGANISAFLFFLKIRHQEYYQRIVKTIQLVIPFFDDFVLRPMIVNEENIRLEWKDKFKDNVFGPSALSDGSLRFICLATLLLQPELPDLIILDEPELGLHPTAITILCGLLKKASARSQIIVSTQSVNLVNEFSANDIIVVDKKQEESTFKRLHNKDLQDWLGEYNIGELWEKNVIGGKP